MKKQKANFIVFVSNFCDTDETIFDIYRVTNNTIKLISTNRVKEEISLFKTNEIVNEKIKELHPRLDYKLRIVSHS